MTFLLLNPVIWIKNILTTRNVKFQNEYISLHLHKGIHSNKVTVSEQITHGTIMIVSPSYETTRLEDWALQMQYKPQIRENPNDPVHTFFSVRREYMLFNCCHRNPKNTRDELCSANKRASFHFQGFINVHSSLSLTNDPSSSNKSQLNPSNSYHLHWLICFRSI